MKNNYYDDYEDMDFDMDYEWVYDENLEKHKTKDKVKWIITAIALLLIAVVLAGLCVKVFWKPKEDKTSEPDDSQTETEQQEPVAVRRLSLASVNAVTPQAIADSYTLTATVEPSNATETNVTWSVDWANSRHSWVGGKTASDYIQIDADGLMATVTVKQAFGAKAEITVRSDSNEIAYATCTVDYVSRLTIPHGGGYMDINRINQSMITDQVFSFNTNMNIKADVVRSNDGTLIGNVSFDTLTVSLGPVIQEYIISQVPGYGTKYTFKDKTFEWGNGLVEINIASPLDFIYIMGNQSGIEGNLLKAFIQACDHYDGTISFRSEFTLTYNGETVQTGACVGDFTVHTTGLAVNVEDIAVDKSSLVF